MPGLRPRPSKKITKPQLERFWRDYDAGRRVIKPIWPLVKTREVIAISRNIIGTVRRFKSSEQLESYLKITKELPSILNQKDPKKFRMQETQIVAIDRKNKRLVERVYMGPCVDEFISDCVPSRYWKSFCQTLKKKEIPLEEARDIVDAAWIELDKVVRKCPSIRQMNADIHSSNLLVLDINKKNRTVLFTLIDARLHN